MIQTFHSALIQTAVQSVSSSPINGLNSGSTVALEVANSFEWILSGN